MYLAKSIIQGEKHYPMIGVFDCDVEMTKKPQGIGYTIQQALPGNVQAIYFRQLLVFHRIDENQLRSCFLKGFQVLRIIKAEGSVPQYG